MGIDATKKDKGWWENFKGGRKVQFAYNGKKKAKICFFFVLIQRSKNHTHSVVYENTNKKKGKYISLLFLDEKKHTHSVFYEKTAQNFG